jgi:hypothetical protein
MTLGDYSSVDVFDVRVEGDQVQVRPIPRAVEAVEKEEA